MFPPEFVSKPDPMTLFVGKQVKFHCVINGSSPMNVAWYKDNIAILPSEHYKMFSEKKKYYFEITNIELSDQGTYLCKASNSVGTATCSTDIRAIDKPSFVKTFETTAVAVGNPLRLECQVNEDTGVAITWTRDGKKLHNTTDSKLSFEEKVASLEIIKAKIKDTGMYVCTATNDAGGSSCSSMVSVKGKAFEINRHHFYLLQIVFCFAVTKDGEPSMPSLEQHVFLRLCLTLCYLSSCIVS